MNRWIIITIISFVVIVILLSLTVFKSRIKSAFYIDHMERPERTERMHIARIVETLNIQAGDIIADIGAGSGLFAREFAVQATSSGKIYAVDINSEILKHIDQTSKEKGITNIITIHSSENDPKIQGKVDLIFMCDTLHYIDQQEAYVRSMSSHIKTNGRIAVVSFHKNWPPMANKFSQQELTAWMNKAGLTLLESHDFIQDEYLNIYRKK